MKKYVGLLLAGLLAACAGRSPESSFYTLAGVGDVTPVSQMTGTVDVARVRIPEYIDRPQIVTMSGVNVHLAQDNRWAEGLGPMIQRKLIHNIGAYLPRATVKDANFAAPAGDYSVFVEIYELNGRLGDTAQLVAAYSVAGDADAASAPHTVRYSEPAGADYTEYVGAVSRMVDRLSRDIAKDIAALK
ncbi:MAG: PqiC family protein [Alphaproteobacteria bacterium]|nr:PqiC family protein [Alphaproteobacteria bacterium]